MRSAISGSVSFERPWLGCPATLWCETTTGTPPCTNDYVKAMQQRHPDRIIHAWAAVDPFKGETARKEATRAIAELGMLGFHFHPIMGRFAVNPKWLVSLPPTVSPPETSREPGLLEHPARRSGMSPVCAFRTAASSVSGNAIESMSVATTRSAPSR